MIKNKLKEIARVKIFFTLDILIFLHCFPGIVPETHSPGMFSWFPIYFPIRVSMIAIVSIVLFLERNVAIFKC